jgi:hypothetical protein
MTKIDTGLITYTATKTDTITDKSGALYITSMGATAPGTPFGIRVWRIAKGMKVRQEVLFYPGDHGGLAVLWGKLFFVHNQAGSKKIVLEEIPGFIPEDGTLSSTTVNLNESQLALINKMIETATKRAEGAYAQSSQAMARIVALEKRIAALEARPAASSSPAGLSKAQIEDVVWTKIWDIFFLLRGGMNEGSSKMTDVQNWINDLTAFIRRVK